MLRIENSLSRKRCHRAMKEGKQCCVHTVLDGQLIRLFSVDSKRPDAIQPRYRANLQRLTQPPTSDGRDMKLR